MIAEFKTPVFKVYISGLADYLGIDGMADPDYKVSKTKMLEWKMQVSAFANRLNDITFTPTRVQFDFSWWVQEEYLEEYDLMNIQKKFDVAIYKGEITGQEIINASTETGWDIQFAQFDLHSSSGYEKEIDEIEVNIFEKTILIR
jgi:hypothetical protein